MKYRRDLIVNNSSGCGVWLENLITAAPRGVQHDSYFQRSSNRVTDLCGSIATIESDWSGIGLHSIDVWSKEICCSYRTMYGQNIFWVYLKV